jgi:hypothetical protein
MALQRVTAPDEVVVIAGNDWSSITPYYAQRRALMIRRNLEHTWNEIEPAFARLKGEDVTALILHGEQGGNQHLIDLAVRDFHLDSRPAFRFRDATVYLHEQIRAQTRELLKNVPEIELLEGKPGEVDPRFRRELKLTELLRRYRDDFAQMKPEPFKYFSSFGTGLIEHEGRKFNGAHPDTRIWFKVSAGRHTMATEAGLLPSAYDDKIAKWDQSDGVEIRLEKETAGGGREVLYSRLLNPRDRESDRGIQQIRCEFELAHDGTVVLSIGPGPSGNYARDWALLGPVEIK